MSEQLILPHQPNRVYIVDLHGNEIEISPDEMWMYEPDAYRSTGEDVRILEISDLPKDEWRNQGDDDE